jgi:hypothetical protein
VATRGVYKLIGMFVCSQVQQRHCQERDLGALPTPMSAGTARADRPCMLSDNVYAM